jgi:carbon monoxide dehydrogenase subunit G
MEHEVFVPVSAESLREALADPARVARAVPGLHQDAGTAPVSGRLKVRIGSTSITYRGAVRVAPRDDGSFSVEGDATEARGSGAVKLALGIRVESVEDGAKLVFDGGASADGRVTELPAETVASAVQRLLNRFAEALGDGAGGAEDVPTTSSPAEQLPAEGEDVADVEEPSSPEPLSLVEDGEDELGRGEGEFGRGEDRFAGDEDEFGGGEPPAEAAHARRTMIGRSAEEVDHAPPRGRYAPVPAPEAVSPRAALRWAAPAAALVLASAIVVGRALRRRR